MRVAVAVGLELTDIEPADETTITKAQVEETLEDIEADRPVLGVKCNGRKWFELKCGAILFETPAGAIGTPSDS